LPNEKFAEKNELITYAFAAPMVGNSQFVQEYNNRYCSDGSSFNFTNPADPIPRFPMQSSDSSFNAQNIVNMIMNKESVDMSQLLAQGAMVLFEDQIKNLATNMSNSTLKQINKDIGNVQMPPYVDELGYHKISNQVRVIPVSYPKILTDSTILQNDSIMAIHKIGTDSHLDDEKFYDKQPWGYQHKPYNYYVAIMKMYFPEQYAVLEKKHLVENL
ncbi:MAG: hypothetical protein MI922_16075, partial [Bacteroidales bacterium]|nr:hypothetical protein [Bacteroidales bacterium]